MNKVKAGLFVLAVAAFGAFAFKGIDGGSITGKVVPPEGATEAWAINGTDTLKSKISEGSFSFKGAKAGNYTLVINAKEPYKDATITDVKVENDKTTDLGDIRLEQ